MNSRYMPWMVGTFLLIAVFIVWLFAQMSRSGRSDRWILTIALAGLLAGVAMAAGYMLRRRRGTGARGRE